MIEEWKDVQGYEGLYEISNTGKVKSLIKGRLLKPANHVKGYLFTTLTKDGKHRRFYIHRLVASAFLDNKEKKSEVNHIDGNKKNNHVDNLEWCSGIENKEHAYRIGKRPTMAQVPVEMFSDSGTLLNAFPSMNEASRVTGIHCGRISNCCSGKCKHAGGYVFRKAMVQNG